MSVPTVAVGTIAGLFVTLPLVAVVTRFAGVRATAALAVLQDTTPLVLLLAWPALVLAIWRRLWWLAPVAAVLCVYHVALMIRLSRRARPPRWVANAPRVSIAVANVYVANRHDHTSAQQLVEAGADVVVVAESTGHYRRAFDGEGGRHRYPHRVYDRDDQSDYAVALYSAIEPLELAMTDVGGGLRAATARLHRDGATLHVIGVNPMAAVDPGGYAVWQSQVHALGRWVAGRREPVAVVGDLNTTIHRAAFDDLGQAGLRDAHDALGQGWRPSFKLSAYGPLGRFGPLVRLDHALCNRWVWPIEVRDLRMAGSDHRPFVATLAVRVPRARRRAGRAPRAPREHRAGRAADKMFRCAPSPGFAVLPR